MRANIRDDNPAGFLRSLGWIALTSFGSFGVGFGGYMLFGLTLAG